MGADTKIEWARHTFNPWVGCTKVSPACDRCYAEAWAKRTGQPALWQGERRRTSAANWRQPIKWNDAAASAGAQQRVFCASLADVFDNQVPDIWRSDLFALIEDTPNLDWLLLTKRPQNIAKMIWPKWDGGLPGNIWLGTTVENKEEADRRIPALLEIPARVRFLSCEPLLGPIDLTKIAVPDAAAGKYADHGYGFNALQREDDLKLFNAPRHIDWVIAGGESGHGARPMHPAWARALRDQCDVADVPFFFKQWGEWEPRTEWSGHLGSGRFEPMVAIMADGTDCPPDVAPQDVGAHRMARVGKKHAGRLLDDCEHNEMPDVR